ncbi:putative ABC transport system permease protein [Roseimicrobium gellanilyticum]|uniref:Putative ABC transport system permease protein n=1 Tax=Roseimicrobium gellanilyticum TaxID=748857 RepID=A0A366HVA5_9BACT|nr:FtsX family ABC transporter permease [Roseimicrobium gellanilyticum]RBP48202.1 putative ABC transport system permease protein [Roseimicrobium gellanilyticum]
MKAVLWIVIAHLRDHPLRLALTSLATAAAAAMVIWVVSSYDALLGTFDEYANLALGRYELSVAPISHLTQVAPGVIPAPAQKYVPEEAVELLRSDAAVNVVEPLWAVQVEVAFHESTAPASRKGWLPDMVIGTEGAAAPFDLVEGRWLKPEASAGSEAEAAMSASAARAFGLKPGDRLLLGAGSRQTTITIVGLVDTPDVEGWSASVARAQSRTPAIGGLFVSTGLLEKVTGQGRRISFVGVGMKPDADITSFRFRWSPQLSALSTPCQFQEAHDVEEALDESASAENLEFQGHMAAVVSMLAALFIILSTLNMGVTERIRQLAILRAVTLTRGQVAMLVIVEALILGAVGFVVGSVVGWSMLKIAVANAPELLEDGARVGRFSLLLAALCAFGGALLASIWPAIRAMRVRPMDVMGGLTRPSRWNPWLTVTGLVLLLLYPLTSRVFPHGDDSPMVMYMLVGVATLAVGFILLSPAATILVDRWLSPVLAGLLRVPPRLLESQLSSNILRTVATAVALTVGLGLLVGIHVWGHTMLGGFMPGAWCPDAMISFRPDGIPKEKALEASTWKGVTTALPVVVEQPRLKQDLTNSATRATVVRQDSVVIVGLDPEKALGSSHPLFSFQWVSGNPSSAIAAMRDGRGCLVPDHFLTETGLKVGDSFELVPPENPGGVVSYVIAGAVKMPGWHWQTKPTGMRTRTHRAAALVFADYGNVAADFQFHGAPYLWLNYDRSQTDVETLGLSAQQLLASTTQKPVTVGEASPGGPHVQVHDVEEIRSIVLSHSRQWLWVLSRLPVVILIITTVGVLNALLASVQARRWEFGVLRAMGITRGVLVRLIIAEGILISLVACLLSLGFGILSGWCGAGMSKYISFFGGMNTDLVIPWPEVLASIFGVIVLSSLAAAWPAFRLGSTKPLELLQQGSASF